MDRKDFEVLEALHRCDDGSWVYPEELKDYMASAAETEQIKSSLRTWKDKNIVKRYSHGPGYMIEPEGVRLVQQRRLDQSISQLDHTIDNLKVFQAKSSAVETIFTVSLLGFAYLQLSASGGDSLFAVGMVVLTISWALLIGLKNLVQISENEVMKKISYLESKFSNLNQWMLAEGA